MKNRIANVILVLVTAFVVLEISRPVDGDPCDTGITKLHLNTTAGAFVDGSTIVIDPTNGLKVSDTCITQAVEDYVDAEITAAIAALVLPSNLSGSNESNGETSIGELQLKWGQITPADSNDHVTFSEMGLSDFTNYCLQVQLTQGDTNTSRTENLKAYSLSKTGFTIKGPVARLTRWFAIGR